MPKNVVVVGGSATENQSIKDILRDYNLVTVRNGTDANILANETDDIDLVILHLEKASADCYNMLSFLQDGKKYKYQRIIVLSDSDLAEDEAKCFKLGAHEYIKKPIQVEVFKFRVRNQLEIVQLHRSSEMKVSNMEHLYESIFQQAPIGIAISHNREPFSDGRENLIGVNAMFEQICGRTKEELLALGWTKITHPDDLDEDLRSFKKLQAGEISSYSMEKRYVKPDGSIVWVFMLVAALNLRNENEYNHICLVQDITEHKVLMSQLEENKKLFRTFIDSSQDFIFLKDEKYRHLIANKALADFYGVGIDEIVGKSDYDLMDTESAGNCRNSDQDVINKNKAVNAIEKLGDKVFETRKFPISIGDGKTGIGAYIKDITAEDNQREIVRKMSQTNQIITDCMVKPFENIQKQLDYALNEAIKLTGSQYGYIYFYDEAAQEFTLNSWTNGVMDDCAVMDKQTKYQLIKTGIWGEVVRQKKPIIVNDFDAPNPLKKGYPEGHVKIHKYMSIPIFENNSIVAVIGFANKQSDYVENDVYAMAVLMSGVWIATKKREKEQETEQLLERTQAMISKNEAAMFLLEPVSGSIIEANSAATRFYGYSREEFLSMTVQDLSVQGMDEVDEYRLREPNKHGTFSHRLKNGESRTVDVYSSPIDDNGHRILFSIVFDVTKREEVTKQNEYLAYHDYLTGIYNRRFFEEEIKRRYSGGYPNAVMMGDVNGLKLFNDTFGHEEGDRALIDIAEKIKNCVKNLDVFARVGGDEFAIIVSNTNEESIKDYIENIEQQVNHVSDCKEKNTLTISFGYGIQRQKEDTIDVLMKSAEAFMYNKKYYNTRSTRSSTVSFIMDTLFAKSEREKKHSERVGLICEALAEGLHFDRQSIDRIRVAGFLHDIGKIGIEENILNKNGKLDKKEWEIMKLHAAKGADILERSVEFGSIANIVLSHHERYDGTGYPNGLRGEEIPIEARMIAVADAYDAMTNMRPYREALSVEAAIGELVKCSGTQFDARVVSVFINGEIKKKVFSGGGSELLPNH